MSHILHRPLSDISQTKTVLLVPPNLSSTQDNHLSTTHSKVSAYIHILLNDITSNNRQELHRTTPRTQASTRIRYSLD